MKMKSISGVTHYVKDMKKATKFYEALGFQFRENKPDCRKIYVNWFWIELCLKKGTKVGPRDEDTLLNIKVEDIDKFYAGVLKTGLKPLSEPEDLPRGG